MVEYKYRRSREEMFITETKKLDYTLKTAAERAQFIEELLPTLTKEQLKSAFESFDENKTGKCSSKILFHSLQSIGEKLSEEDINELSSKCTIDENGNIIEKRIDNDKEIIEYKDEDKNKIYISTDKDGNKIFKKITPEGNIIIKEIDKNKNIRETIIDNKGNKTVISKDKNNNIISENIKKY